MSADEAAALIPPGANVGMSGYAGAGDPKAVPRALARRIVDANLSGQKLRIGVWTGASTAPELDGALAMEVEEHAAQLVRHGFLGALHVALVEVTAIREDGALVPSSSVGNNVTWIECADRVILEVNGWQREQLEGMHDIYEDEVVPHRRPIPIARASDRIGSPHIACPVDKVLAIVETNAPDRTAPFAPPDEDARRIAGHVLEFLAHEVKKGRMPENLLPLQAGVGRVASAVLEALNDGPFADLSAYTEVIDDGLLALLRSGRLRVASATALSPSAAALERLDRDLDDLRARIVLRPQEISNHPGVIRRLGVLAMNEIIEADIYGNVNATHVMGTRVQRGIGGGGEFARNAYCSIFMTPSTAKGGTISCVVPMASHVDHTEHDVHVIATEQGLADLRGLSPKDRAHAIIERCAHPDYRPLLRDYLRRTLELSPGRQTPHRLEESLAFHLRYLRHGTMRA